MSESGQQSAQNILHVAINTPVANGFDYLANHDTGYQLSPGVRLRVPFGHRKVTAVLIEQRSNTSIAQSKLKQIEQVLDDTPVIPADLLKLAQWVSQYYHHPLGEVIHTMLPATLRQGRSNTIPLETLWYSMSKADINDLKRAPKQSQLLQAILKAPEGLSESYLQEHFHSWRPAVKALAEKGFIASRQIEPLTPEMTACADPNISLNADQQNALDLITESLNRFQTHLLQGVTGSGKTEVYLRLINQVLANKQQTLVLVPEIGLTPQLLERFTSRLPCPIYVLHSAMTDQQRLQVWQTAQSGQAYVIIGTRSAVFLPLQNPGLIIVDEEHDNSLKQQDGLRYNARDLAIMRAHHNNIPVVLGSATPSLETLQNAFDQRYSHLQLPMRAGPAVLPQLKLIDARITPKQQILSKSLLEAMRAHLQNKSQVLLFLNRRGFAPRMLCHSCGWAAECSRCDAHMTLHQHENILRCHHCGHQHRPPATCPGCGEAKLDTIGVGTEQIEHVVQQHFPEYSVARIDRDAVKRKGELEKLLTQAQRGDIDILIGTQMLAKGHHFPQVTLVGILGIDQGLFSADFRGPEYMAQLLTQVAGRAGRAEQRGEVLIETQQPENSLLQILLKQDYTEFAKVALQERQAAILPPFSKLALIRAEAVTAEQALQFLQQVRQGLVLPTDVQILGPIPAPMERRAGRYRAQLLLQAQQRKPLQQALTILRSQAQQLPDRRKVRWSIDVDPTEML